MYREGVDGSLYAFPCQRYVTCPVAQHTISTEHRSDVEEYFAVSMMGQSDMMSRAKQDFGGRYRVHPRTSRGAQAANCQEGKIFSLQLEGMFVGGQSKHFDLGAFHGRPAHLRAPVPLTS